MLIRYSLDEHRCDNNCTKTEQILKNMLQAMLLCVSIPIWIFDFSIQKPKSINSLMTCGSQNCFFNSIYGTKLNARVKIKRSNWMDHNGFNFAVFPSQL